MPSTYTFPNPLYIRVAPIKKNSSNPLTGLTWSFWKLCSDEYTWTQPLRFYSKQTINGDLGAYKLTREALTSLLP